MAKRKLSSLATAAMFLGLVFLPTQPALADEPVVGESAVGYLVDRADGRCATLTDPGLLEAYTLVSMTACKPIESTPQAWTMVDDELIVAANGAFMQAPKRAVAGDPVKTGKYTGLHSQEWRYDAATGQLHPKDFPGLAVTAGETLLLDEWAGVPEQQWDFASSLTQAPPEVEPIADSPEAQTDEAEDSLPTTGSDTGMIATVGGALLVTGVVALLAFRGRRRLLRGAGYW